MRALAARSCVPADTSRTKGGVLGSTDLALHRLGFLLCSVLLQDIVGTSVFGLLGRRSRSRSRSR